MSLFSIGLSDSVRGAFKVSGVIGVKVIDQSGLMERLHDELEKWLEKREPWGSFELVLPNTEPRVISFGVGQRCSDMKATDFHVRIVDGWPTVFLKRGHALAANTVTCKMMTRAAWLKYLKAFPADRREEQERVQNDQNTHYLVEIVDAVKQKSFSPEVFITTILKDSTEQANLRIVFTDLYSVRVAARDMVNFMKKFWPVADPEE